MTALRDTVTVVVTEKVQPAARRTRFHRPAPRPTMPEPEVTSKDLSRMPAALRRAVLESCGGDLYRLSWGEDGSIVVV